MVKQLKKLTVLGAIFIFTISQSTSSYAANATKVKGSGDSVTQTQNSTNVLDLLGLDSNSDTKYSKGSARVKSESDVPYGTNITQTYSYWTYNTLNTVLPGKQITFPGWYWVDQYCYYFTNYHTVLKSTTTPDGYTVDENGRWIVDGVAQTNDYGSQIIGTDTLYSGKSQDEINDLIINLSMDTLSKYKYSTDNSFAYKLRETPYSDGSVSRDLQFVFGNEISNTGTEGSCFNTWSDGVLFNGTGDIGSEYINERLIKILLGDHVGQELFNEMRSASEPLGGSGLAFIRDDNGNTSVYSTFDEIVQEMNEANGGINSKKVQNYDNRGDGFNIALFDTSKWQNRTTDYGRRFYITTSENIDSRFGTSLGSLLIHFYAN